MRKFPSVVSSLALAYLMHNPVSAQMSAQKDTSGYPFATRDTLETITVTSNLYWYDIDNRRHAAGDSSTKMIFNHKQEKALIYTDISDLFLENTLWYAYNLAENGRPAYISAINRYPHQTPFLYNGIPMNEPIHGMFNSQFISVNNTYMIESDLLSTSGMAQGAIQNVTSFSRHTVAAWSRILYKEGTYYGFSDLDISFVKPITQNLAFQLGGFNKTYDGSSRENSHQGTNYRGEVTYQCTPNLYLRGQFFLSREQVGIRPIVSDIDIPLPRHRESRNDYLVDMTWSPSDSSRERLHVTTFYSYADRKFLDNSSDYRVKNYFRRYGLDANWLWFFDNYQLLLGGTITVPAGWGSAMAAPYHRYYTTTAQTYAELFLPAANWITFKPAFRVVKQQDYSTAWNPALHIDFTPLPEHRIRCSAGSYQRFPNLNERFFMKDSLAGNSDVKPEHNYSFLAGYMYAPGPRFSLMVQGGYHRIEDEINYYNFTFHNDTRREFTFIGPELGVSLWKFNLRCGGHYLLADKNITAKNSGWAKAHFHDIWLKGAVMMDAYGTINYFGEHARLQYEPRMERFYSMEGVLPSYWLLNWKIVATVKQAQIFVEMKNNLSEQYEVVYGYMEYYWKFQFGVNWIFWD